MGALLTGANVVSSEKKHAKGKKKKQSVHWPPQKQSVQGISVRHCSQCEYSQHNRSYCVLLSMSGFTTVDTTRTCSIYLGLYIANTARTVSNSAANVDSASSIRSTKILSKAPITCRGRSMQGESAKTAFVFFFAV